VSDLTDLPAWYVASGNMSDEGRRAAAIVGLFAVDAVSTGLLAGVPGHGGVGAVLAGGVGGSGPRSGGCSVRSVPTIASSVSGGWWCPPAGGGSVAVGFDVVVSGGGGRFKGVCGFLDKVPAGV
jgi:hypothetical protein